MYAVVRSVVILSQLVFTVTDITILLLSLDGRLESLSLAMSHQDNSGWYFGIHIEAKP